LEVSDAKRYWLAGHFCSSTALSAEFGIALVSPPLDVVGNVVRAQVAVIGIPNSLGGKACAAKPWSST